MKTMRLFAKIAYYSGRGLTKITIYSIVSESIRINWLIHPIVYGLASAGHVALSLLSKGIKVFSREDELQQEAMPASD